MNPFELHPNLNIEHYHGAGMGGVDEKSGSTIGMVKVSALHDMPGNAIRDWDMVRSLARDLESGKGYRNPLLVEYNHSSRTATLGEGNHRLKALQLVGHEYAPVTVGRMNYPVTNDTKRGRIAKQIGPGGRGWPFKGGMGELWVPSDIHPSWVFHPSEVYNEGW